METTNIISYTGYEYVHAYAERAGRSMEEVGEFSESSKCFIISREDDNGQAEDIRVDPEKVITAWIQLATATGDDGELVSVFTDFLKFSPQTCSALMSGDLLGFNTEDEILEMEEERWKSTEPVYISYAYFKYATTPGPSDAEGGVDAEPRREERSGDWEGGKEDSGLPSGIQRLCLGALENFLRPSCPYREWTLDCKPTVPRILEIMGSEFPLIKWVIPKVGVDDARIQTGPLTEMKKGGTGPIASLLQKIIRCNAYLQSIGANVRVMLRYPACKEKFAMATGAANGKRIHLDWGRYSHVTQKEEVAEKGAYLETLFEEWNKPRPLIPLNGQSESIFQGQIPLPPAYAECKAINGLVLQGLMNASADPMKYGIYTGFTANKPRDGSAFTFAASNGWTAKVGQEKNSSRTVSWVRTESMNLPSATNEVFRLNSGRHLNVNDVLKCGGGMFIVSPESLATESFYPSVKNAKAGVSYGCPNNLRAMTAALAKRFKKGLSMGGVAIGLKNLPGFSKYLDQLIAKAEVEKDQKTLTEKKAALEEAGGSAKGKLSATIDSLQGKIQKREEEIRGRERDVEMFLAEADAMKNAVQEGAVRASEPPSSSSSSFSSSSSSSSSHPSSSSGGGRDEGDAFSLGLSPKGGGENRAAIADALRMPGGSVAWGDMLYNSPDSLNAFGNF